MITMAPAAKRRRQRTRARLSILTFTIATFIGALVLFDRLMP